MHTDARIYSYSLSHRSKNLSVKKDIYLNVIILSHIDRIVYGLRVVTSYIIFCVSDRRTFVCTLLYTFLCKRNSLSSTKFVWPTCASLRIQTENRCFWWQNTLIQWKIENNLFSEKVIWLLLWCSFRLTSMFNDKPI